jgi:hypothetical protein
MLSGTHSRPLARPSLVMATSRFLVRYGELWCEQDSDIHSRYGDMAFAPLFDFPSLILVLFIFFLHNWVKYDTRSIKMYFINISWFFLG